MPQYVLLMYQPAAEEDAARREEGDLSQEEMAKEHQRWMALTEDLKKAGALVDNRGLQATEAATTVRVRDGETQITDGPFAETKEYLAGYILVEAADLDTALEYAAQVPSVEYGSVEVRPVWG